MKKILVMLCAVALVFGAVGTASALLYNGHEYELVIADLNWSDARLAAQGLGAGWDLATITSQEEQENVIEILVAEAHPNGVNRITEYWLGGYQLPGVTPADAGWTWVTGEEWIYNNWAGPVEPNDWGGLAAEQYLAIDSRYGWAWNDNTLSSSQVVGYIAERVVPEPSTVFLLGVGVLGLVGLGRKRIKK